MAGPPSSRSRSALRARLERNPLLVDTLLALGLTAVSLVTVVAGAGDFGRVDTLSLVLIVLQTLPLAYRRVAPVPVFRAVTEAPGTAAPDSSLTTPVSVAAVCA